MSEPHAKLKPLLDKFGVSYAAFLKKGRPTTSIVSVRSEIITEFHAQGMSWSEMILVTGLSQGTIQRLTKAMWNDASRKNRQDQCSAMGHARKGEKRPYVVEQMKKQWAEGLFDFHRGRVRGLDERQKLKDGWTEDRRKHCSQKKLTLWKDPNYRTPLMEFHQSPEERARRSVLQTQRLIEDPVKWSRGKGMYVDSLKGTTNRFWVRSSYEVATVKILDSDPTVISYQYEETINLEDGSWILPDFIVTYVDRICIVEVKAFWATVQPPEHKSTIRLTKAREFAKTKNWCFEIWTEKDKLHGHV